MPSSSRPSASRLLYVYFCIYIHVCVCVYTCVCVHVYMYMYLGMSCMCICMYDIYLSFCLSVYLSAYLPIYLSISLSIYPFICLCLFLKLCIWPSYWLECEVFHGKHGCQIPSMVENACFHSRHYVWTLRQVLVLLCGPVWEGYPYRAAQLPMEWVAVPGSCHVGNWAVRVMFSSMSLGSVSVS